MDSNLTRRQARSFFLDSWRKFRQHRSLTPLEEVAVDWINEHPEFHQDLEKNQTIQEKDYSPEDGKINPFLHLSMHLSISEQVAMDNPPGIKSIYYELIRRTGSEHHAAHNIMDCLAEMIWTAQKQKSPLDFKKYSKSIQGLLKKEQSETSNAITH
ncbi:DUF1841 family protein [Chromobacterium piscinae]|uniref:DUF1841 family protein n=1 Tax=Chromobacterium piscinae TaxID=686831 RepID=UPI001E600E64|nr:DUF1841 family protein [Chromobacterium piscinae]MCD5330853.1 DUF1841 family protein [Chromobacterium piscinae]